MSRSVTPDTVIGLLGVAVVLVVVADVWFDRASGGIDVLLVLSGCFRGERRQ